MDSKIHKKEQVRVIQKDGGCNGLAFVDFQTGAAAEAAVRRSGMKVSNVRFSQMDLDVEGGCYSCDDAIKA